MSFPVAILGANGTVGQKFLALLQQPSFQAKYHVAEIAASAERVGKFYEDEVEWRETGPMPEAVRRMRFSPLGEVQSAYVLSALPADVALTIEPLLAGLGRYVFSNASAFRMDPTVPLLIPEINLLHLSLLEKQKTSGKIITNPNCSTVFLTMALKPLMELSKVRHLSVTTLQAISGAGYPGVPSLDIMGNIVPNISGEEEKIQQETKKIVGEVGVAAPFTVSVQVNRVPVQHGHTISMHVEFEGKVTPEDVKQVYKTWNKKYPELFQIYDQPFRPQPAKDITDFDQRVHIGRIKQGDGPNRISLISLGHNLVRGAAGAAIANMEATLPLLTSKVKK